MRRLLLLAVLVGAAVFAAPGATAKTKSPAPAPGGAKAPAFGGDIVLPGGQGAEPSLAIDTSPTASRGDIYAAAIGDSNGPLEWHSYDGGKTWSQPVPFDTSGQVRGEDQDIAGNTNGDLLAVDPDIALNFLYSCSPTAENAQHPPFGPLHDYYLAKSTDGGLTWTTHPVFQADTSNGKAPSYANIFGTLAIDSAGNYYTLFDGTADDHNADTNPYHVYLEV